MQRIRPESLAFTLLLGALGTLPTFGIDTALPALLQIAGRLQTSVGMASLTLSTFLAGFAVAQLVFGPLSDRYGRRPTLLAGCALFAAASFLCAIAPTIEFLLVARFIAGCGAGAGMVMVFAMVRDNFEGPAGRTKLSFVTMVINIAPMIAPSIGALILGVGDWRTIYAALGVGGVLLTAWIALGLGESLKQPNPQALQALRIYSAYAQVLRHPVAFPYILVMGLSFGCMFAWVAGSAFVMIQLFGLSTAQYGMAFAGTALSILSGSALSGVLSQRRVSGSVLLSSGLLLVFLCAIAIAVLVGSGVSAFWILYPLLVACVFGFGVIAPNAAHGVMQPMPHMAGVAGASLGFVQMVCGALSAALVAAFGDASTTLAMAGVMAGSASLALAIYWLRIRPVEALAASH